MDVEMERNGLPTSFGNPHDAESNVHEASDVAGSASNAEFITAPPVKSMGYGEVNEPTTTSTPITETSQAPLMEAPIVESRSPDLGYGIEEETHSNLTASINGRHLESAPMTDSSPQTQADSVLSSAPSHLATNSSIPLSSSIEYITETSFPAAAHIIENPSEMSSVVIDVANEPIQISQPSISDFHTEPTPLPEPPISDLRNQPGPDLLISETEVISRGEPQEATLAPTTQSATTGLLQEESALPQPSDTMSQPPPVTRETLSTSLDAPPTEIKPFSSQPHSPPPAPQPEPAVLPVSQSLHDSTIIPGAPISPPAEPIQEDVSMTVLPPRLPVEEPRDLVPNPIQPPIPEAHADQVMTDAPTPPFKIAREREDDQEESAPVSKRVKTDTEDDQPAFKVPDVPVVVQSPPATNGASTTIGEDDQVTPARLAHMKKIISNLKKGNSSMAFRLPVDWKALNIPNYPEVVKEPMDLGTIDSRLKQNQYTSVKTFIADFKLIVINCRTFNGKDHAVTQSAEKMENSFNNQIVNMPATAVAEPSKEEKKALKHKVEPTRTAPPRRQSVTAPTGGSARSPSAANSGQTFAVGPEGIPLIRRDSTVQDGRAKRAIIPTKRHSDFGAGRPKKKKYELQLKFSWEVLKELQSPKHWQYAQYFYDPVDPVALNIPTYFQIIKKPMDLKTIQTKLEGNAYEKAKDFEEDVRLIFKNCFKFNPEGEFVNDCGRKLEEVFNKKWDTKEDWLAAREPTSESHSAAEEEDDDEEESDEAEDDSEDERNDKIALLQKQIAEMSKQMGELAQPKKKKKSTPPQPPKKSGKSKGEKKEKSSRPFKGADAKPTKKKTKVKEERERFVTYAEKQYISNGISQLPDKQMGEALKIIQTNVPSLKDTAETEIELDIDELPNKVLVKLLDFVQKYGGGPLPEEVKPQPSYNAPAAGGKPKKNKPMGKSEQETQIEELKAKLGAYNGGLSPNAVPSIENNMDTSGDEGSDSEESEEE